LEHWESTWGLDIDVGDGSVPVDGALVEDREDSDERYGGMGVGQYVRYLVTADREEH
jgi:hypothetical protein